ncbi:MAG: OmpA family protein [Archangium sp.]
MKRITTIGLATAAFALAAVGCAHEKPRKLTPPSMAAIRLDEKIRSSCNSSTSVTPVFDFNSSELSNEAQDSLRLIANCVSTGALKDKTLRVVGYTDPVGTRQDNKELGYDRAESVASYLESHGVSRSQLKVESRGEEGASPDPARWPADRIVDLSVLN